MPCCVHVGHITLPHNELFTTIVWSCHTPVLRGLHFIQARVADKNSIKVETSNKWAVSTNQYREIKVRGHICGRWLEPHAQQAHMHIDRVSCKTRENITVELFFKLQILREYHIRHCYIVYNIILSKTMFHYWKQNYSIMFFSDMAELPWLLLYLKLTNATM